MKMVWRMTLAAIRPGKVVDLARCSGAKSCWVDPSALDNYPLGALETWPSG
jgi:hypothetical protein